MLKFPPPNCNTQNTPPSMPPSGMGMIGELGKYKDLLGMLSGMQKPPPAPKEHCAAPPTPVDYSHTAPCKPCHHAKHEPPCQPPCPPTYTPNECEGERGHIGSGEYYYEYVQRHEQIKKRIGK